jgi:hypothetical protein
MRFQIQRGKFKFFTVTPNMDMGTRSKLGDLLQFGWFNLHLDLNFEEIPDPEREIEILHRSKSGDLLQFGWFNLHLDLNFEEIPDLEREI